MDTLSKLSTQIVNYNKNVLELFSKLNDIIASNSNTITINYQNELGVVTPYNAPSFGFILNEISRLNESIKSLYGLESESLVDFGDGKYRKIVTIDLNREPRPIRNIDVYNTFMSYKNNFYDNLVNPYLYININLNDRVDETVRKVISRRYIVEFERDVNGNLTTNGQIGYTSFLSRLNGKNNITLNDFLNWAKTTVGVLNPIDLNYDEEVIDVEPSELLYDGVFSVIKIEEDLTVNKIWYYLDKLTYYNVKTGEVRELVEGDEFILNSNSAYTRYKITSISKVATLPRVTLDIMEGYQSIPVITNALKLYKTEKIAKSIRVGIGYNEKCVLFIKPLDTTNNIASKEWSLGSGFNTSEFTYVSSDSNNGKTMEDFYVNNVSDVGRVLREMGKMKVPFSKGVIPNAPVLSSDNFKVVEVNTHLTKSSDILEINKKVSLQKEIKSDLVQLDDAIKNKNKEIRLASNLSNTDNIRVTAELDQLIKLKASKSSALESTISEVVSLSASPVVKNAIPKYRIRGFWDFPNPVVVSGTMPQEVIQFKIEYRYLTKGSNDVDIKSYQFTKTDGTRVNAAYSNWIPMKSDVRKRIYDAQTDSFKWVIEDVSDADTPNINQIDIPITFGESVEIRIKSISEVGYPDNPLESMWSNVLTVDFPDNITDTSPITSGVLQDMTKDELVIRVKNEFSNIDAHVSNVVTIGNKTYYHSIDDIYSGVEALSLRDMIRSMQMEIESLKEQLNKTKGKMLVSVFRNDSGTNVKNESEIVFNVECEDYLDKYTGVGVNGRVYNNSIYAIRDFYIKIENTAVDTPLGLVSSKRYENGIFYNRTAPQIFWVNDRDELLYSNTTGVSRTQLNNQYIWLYNYNDGNETTVNKISENISNNFTTIGNNSITNVLSLSEYNIGYSESELLTFVEDNKSLMDMSKWVDITPTVQSNEKLLSTIHPVVQSLDYLTDRNSSNIKSVDASSSIIIPIVIYFKMNAIDPNDGNGLNYDYIDLTKAKSTIRHSKVVKFYFENEGENKPFIFKVKFNLNKNKVGISNVSSSFNITSGEKF